MGNASTYTCPDYAPESGSRSPRCVHYQHGGRCGREGTLYCLEWLRKNNLEEERDLFGNTTLKKSKGRKKPSDAHDKTDKRDIPCVRNITEEQIRSFKELGAEVCISSPDTGDIWLVPEYTYSERQEISADHAATLAVIVSAFPGARITAFNKSAPSPESSNPTPEEASP